MWDRIAYGSAMTRQAGDEGPRVGRDDQRRQAVAEAHRDHQRAEPVLGAAPPGEQPRADEGRADQRAEDRDQVAVVTADAVDGDGE